jgi:hypothetical protein
MAPNPAGQTPPFCSTQEEIQWGIVFLSEQLRDYDQEQREECLREVWEWARRRADLRTLNIIKDYRECVRAIGPIYLRHRTWRWSNQNNPAFWAEWKRRFVGLDRGAHNLRAGLAPAEDP